MTHIDPNSPSLPQTGGTQDDNKNTNTKWSCLKAKAKSLPQSNKFWTVLLVVGVVGLGVGGVGFFAHMGMLPASLAKLNALGAMGNYAIATMAVGGGMSLAGTTALIVLAIRKQNSTRAETNKIIEEKSDETVTTDSTTTSEKTDEIISEETDEIIEEESDEIAAPNPPAADQNSEIAALQEKYVEQYKRIEELTKIQDDLVVENIGGMYYRETRDDFIIFDNRSARTTKIKCETERERLIVEGFLNRAAYQASPEPMEDIPGAKSIWNRAETETIRPSGDIETLRRKIAQQNANIAELNVKINELRQEKDAWQYHVKRENNKAVFTVAENNNVPTTIVCQTTREENIVVGFIIGAKYREATRAQ
jgi:hypothetical protein